MAIKCRSKKVTYERDFYKVIMISIIEHRELKVARGFSASKKLKKAELVS
jgi:hypothetical protein